MAEDRGKLFEMVDRMPTFSQNVVRIIELTSDIDTAPKELVRLIEHDPILTLKVLKLVNSAYFGLSKPVNSVRQGVVYVGLNTIKHLAVSIAAIGALPKTNQAGFDMNVFWTHSLVAAAAAKLLAQAKGVARADATGHFIAALLHDVGQVVFAQFMPAEYSAVLARSRAGEAQLALLEQQALGISHAELGAVLAEHWKLPPEFAAAIRHHHDPAALTDGSVMDRCVFVANQVAKLRAPETERLSVVEPVPPALAAWLGMPLEDVGASLPGLEQEIEIAQGFVQVSA
jgi:putative nucleotidyltransferase with HDIG domain